MTSLNNTIATLAFYRLLGQPLSIIEIFKYLSQIKPDSAKPLFSDIFFKIDSDPAILQENGFYFLSPNKSLIRERIKREKISSQKWKKIKLICRFLQFIPFIRGAGITGSLTLNNARAQSDFDFLIITQVGRIWSVRAIVSILLGLLNQKRFGEHTRDKVCLNCFLAGNSLNIKEEIKPHNLYSAQEYGRLLPIFEHSANLWANFKQANQWINDYLPFYPWATDTFYSLSSNRLADFIRNKCEQIFNLGSIGNLIEQIFKSYQIKRIKKNLTNNPDDQIFFSDQYLLFHPHSKSVKILEEFNKIMYVPR